MQSNEKLAVHRAWPQLADLRTSENRVASSILDAAWKDAEASFEPTLKHYMVKYSDRDSNVFQGFIVRLDNYHSDTLPCVLVAHTAIGCQEDFLLQTLDSIARLGYVAFGLDMFGTGTALWDKNESLRVRKSITDDREILANRVSAAYTAALSLPEVDKNRVAAVGFCFGGLVVLDMIRIGLNLNAAITFHGILSPPATLSSSFVNQYSKARVLVFNGRNDPFVSEEQLIAFKDEFTSNGIDPIIYSYDDTYHAFTRPEKVFEADKAAGLYYNQRAANSSWLTMVQFLKTVFEEDT